MFRAGVWKPRTKPGGFEGHGEPALKWLKQVKEETGMLIGTEVATPEHVQLAMNYGVDILWIGARTTANPFAVQLLADSMHGLDIPVLVKNPVNPDLELWIGALERINAAGIKQLGVIHRGFSSYDKSMYRNAPMWQIPIELRRRIPDLPIFCDPSHMGGKRELIAPLCQQALDIGADGLMIESHCDPSCALSDAKQQLTPDALGRLLASLVIREKDSDSVDYRENIDQLRAQIDILDENLLFTLKSRMEISRKIGLFKKEHNIAILQTARWDELLGEMVSKGQGYGLTEGFVKDVFNAIHEASVQVQNEILSQD